MPSPRLERMKEEATCSICLKLMTEPVIIDCGHSYCSVCLVDVDKDEPPASAPRAYFCPQCQTQIQNVSVRPNKQLQSLIEAVKEMDLENLCEEHGDQLRLFCEDDGQLICWRCERSPQHRGHATLLVSDACQGYKKKIEETVEKLKELEVKCNSMEILTSQHITECMKTVNQKQKVQADFTKLQNFLHEEEKCHLWRLGKERERVLKSLREGEARLERQSQELQNHILQLEEKAQASAEMLLQDVKDVLNRSSAVMLELPETVSLSLDNVCNVSELYFDVKKIAKSYQVFGGPVSSMNSPFPVFKFSTSSSSSGPAKTASNSGSFKYGDQGGFRISVSSDSGPVNPINGSFTFSKSTGDFKFGISSDSVPEEAKDSQTDANFKFGGFPSLSNAASPSRMSKLGQQVKKKKQPNPSRSFSPGAATRNSTGLGGKGKCSFGNSDTKSVSAAPFTWMIPEAKKEGLPTAKAGFVSSSTEPAPLPSAPLFVWGNTGEKQVPGPSTSQVFGKNTYNQEPKCQPVLSLGFLEQVKCENSSKSSFSLSTAKPCEKGTEQPTKATFALGGSSSTTTDQGAKPVCGFLKSNSSNSGTPAVPSSTFLGGYTVSSTAPVVTNLFGETISLLRDFGSSAETSTLQPPLFSQESKPAPLGPGSLFGSGSGLSSSFATTCNSSATSGPSIFGAQPTLPSLPPPSVQPSGSGLFPSSQAPAALTMGSNEKNLFFSLSLWPEARHRK